MLDKYLRHKYSRQVSNINVNIRGHKHLSINIRVLGLEYLMLGINIWDYKYSSLDSNIDKDVDHKYSIPIIE